MAYSQYSHVLQMTKGRNSQMAVCQNLVPLVNIKIAGKWMFIPLKMVLIGIDPYPDVPPSSLWWSRNPLPENLPRELTIVPDSRRQAWPGRCPGARVPRCPGAVHPKNGCRTWNHVEITMIYHDLPPIYGCWIAIYGYWIEIMMTNHEIWVSFPEKIFMRSPKPFASCNCVLRPFSNHPAGRKPLLQHAAPATSWHIFNDEIPTFLRYADIPNPSEANWSINWSQWNMVKTWWNHGKSQFLLKKSQHFLHWPSLAL